MPFFEVNDEISYNNLALATATAPYTLNSSVPESAIVFEFVPEASRKTQRSIIRQRRSPGQRLQEERLKGTDPQTPEMGGQGGKPPRKPPERLPVPPAPDDEEDEAQSNQARLDAIRRRKLNPFGRSPAIDPEFRAFLERLLAVSRQQSSEDYEKPPSPEEIHDPYSDEREELDQKKAAVWSQLKQRIEEARRSNRLSRKDVQVINSQMHQAAAASDFWSTIPVSHMEGYSDADETDEHGRPKKTVHVTAEYASEMAALDIATILHIDDELRRIARVLKDQEFTSVVDEYIALRRIPDIAILETPLNGASVLEVLTQTPKTEDELEKALLVMMETYKLCVEEAMILWYEDEGDDKRWEEERQQVYQPLVANLPSPEARQFPNIINQSVDTVVSNSVLLVDANTRVLQKMVRPYTTGPNAAPARAATRKTIDIIQIVTATRSRIRELFTDPEKIPSLSPDLLILVNQYLSDEGLISDRLLHLMMLDDPASLARAYRNLTNYIASLPDQSDEHRLLLDHFYRYAAQIDLSTIDDIETIIAVEEVDKSDERQDLFWDSIFRGVNRVRQATRDTEFLLNEDNVDLAAIVSSVFVEPRSVAVVFDNQKPHCLTVALSYENEETGESLDVRFTIDAKKRVIDWNVLEEMPAGIKKIALQIVQNALSSAEKKAHEKRGPKKDEIPESAAPPKLRGEKIHYRDPIYDFRKTLHPGNVQVAAMQRGATVEALKVSNRPTIQYEIVVTENDQDRFIRKLPPVVQRAIIEGIDTYNGGRRGKFKRMVSRYTGQALWRLRVGDYRILVHEEGSTQGYMRFAIVDICQKKATYGGAAGIY